MQGRTLSGRYYILRVLGGGGFSQTYLAEDRQLPGNPQCVVKHLIPQSTDPFVLQTARRLFNSEAEVLYQLGDCSQIPRLLAHFEENHEFYLVQEYIEGKVLDREITPGKRLSEIEVITLLEDILEVLALVHQHHVIHRDLKLANLIKRSQDGKIVLIDFGAVKQISSQMVNLPGQTTVAVGTPGYMPSEQFSGKPMLSSDIYAVGIIGLQALTGLTPLQLPKDPQMGEIAWRDRAEVSSELAVFLDKMVRYDFRQRYQSAAEALQAIKDLKQALFPQRRSFILLASIGLGIATILVIAIVWWHSISQQIELSVYQNQAYRVRLKYPTKWQKQEKQDPFSGQIVKFISPKNSDTDSYQEQIEIGIEDPNIDEEKPPMSLNEFTNSTLNRVPSVFQDTNIVESKSGTLANLPAYTVVYSGKEGALNLKRLQIWTLKNNRAYIITYTAEVDKYDELLNITQEMINSFEIE